MMSRSGGSVTIASDMNTSVDQTSDEQTVHSNSSNRPLSIQKTVARKAVSASGMPNHRLKKTGQI